MRHRPGQRLIRGAGALVAVCAVGSLACSTVASATVGVTVAQPPNIGHDATTSLDWAGYAVTGVPVTSVTGTWVQPSVSCPTGKAQLSAAWLGIDGYQANDPSVEQVGTDADCSKAVKKVPGGPTYYAWYEFYPAALVVLNPATYPVSPGDVLSGSVTVSGNRYTVALVDGGRWSWSTVVTATSVLANASAEWIAESPVLCKGTDCKVSPLAPFTPLVFSALTINGGALDATGLATHQITMRTKNGKLARAVPSSLDATGASFTVSWLHV